MVLITVNSIYNIIFQNAIGAHDFLEINLDANSKNYFLRIQISGKLLAIHDLGIIYSFRSCNSCRQTRCARHTACRGFYYAAPCYRMVGKPNPRKLAYASKFIITGKECTPRWTISRRKNLKPLFLQPALSKILTIYNIGRSPIFQKDHVRKNL